MANGEGYRASEKLGDWVMEQMNRVFSAARKVGMAKEEADSLKKWKKRQQQRANVESQLRELEKSGDF